MVKIKESEKEQVFGQTRRQLLEAAALAFAKEGYEGANINRISLAAGFAKGTIYNYFPSKRALLLALVDEAAETHLRFLSERVGDEGDLLRRLEKFFEAGFDFVPQYLPQAMVLFNMLQGADQEIKEYLFKVYQPIFQYLTTTILIPGMEKGVFEAGDPVEMAVLLMTIYLGTASHLDSEGHPRFGAGQVSHLLIYGLWRKENR